jgi:hypothetical protein
MKNKKGRRSNPFQLTGKENIKTSFEVSFVDF